jgi:hypothetical protein
MAIRTNAPPALTLRDLARADGSLQSCGMARDQRATQQFSPGERNKRASTNAVEAPVPIR